MRARLQLRPAPCHRRLRREMRACFKRTGESAEQASPPGSSFTRESRPYGRLKASHGGRLVIVDEPPVKKRAANAAKENAGINYVRHITDREEHIFRGVHEEDVGVDAHIELCHRPEEPSGFVVGVQVKAGESYIRNETESTFTFYPSIEDLQYWLSYALPDLPRRVPSSAGHRLLAGHQEGMRRQAICGYAGRHQSLQTRFPEVRHVRRHVLSSSDSRRTISTSSVFITRCSPRPSRMTSTSPHQCFQSASVTGSDNSMRQRQRR